MASMYAAISNAKESVAGKVLSRGSHVGEYCGNSEATTLMPQPCHTVQHPEG
ncbi:hypothetical protein LPJ54_002507, partial [Coemansia sp. RSA 1824]